MKKGGARNMCEVFDEYQNKGKIEGKIEAYLDMECSVEDIASKVNISVEEVERMIASIKQQ